MWWSPAIQLAFFSTVVSIAVMQLWNNKRKTAPRKNTLISGLDTCIEGNVSLIIELNVIIGFIEANNAIIKYQYQSK